MSVKIGDKVRFLDAKGGGKVVAFKNQNMVMVEDEDGFEIPTLISQCVVVTDEGDALAAGHAPIHEAPLSKAQMQAARLLSETEKLQEEIKLLKERIHALENENEQLKMALLRAQYPTQKDVRSKGDIRRASHPEKTPLIDSVPGRLRGDVIEVDLHINELVDTTTGLDNAAMLNIQLDTFRRVMNAYKNAKGQKIVFIHGKGEGVLRHAVLDDLRLRFPKCEWQDASFQQYGFGATMVIVK